jgi:hypothetical protein
MKQDRADNAGIQYLREYKCHIDYDIYVSLNRVRITRPNIDSTLTRTATALYRAVRR